MPLPPGFEPLTAATTPTEQHLVIARDTARLRLCVRFEPTNYTRCLIIPHDECAALRLAATARYERVTCGLRLGPDRAGAPSAYRRSRLVELLAIHDGLDAGSSVRDLAYSLVFTRHVPLVGATWKGSDERRHTLRLIAAARRLVNGGYRKLLRHR